MIVKFWGTRGCIPVPGVATQIYGGNTPCVEIRTENALFICDAGSGIRLLGADLKRRKTTPATHLFLSHLHSAHIQGLPFFHPLFDAASPARIYACRTDLAPLKQATSSDAIVPFGPGKKFSASFQEFNEGKLEIDGIKIKSFALDHPGGCSGYSFESEGAKVVYIPDNELPIQDGDKFPDPKHQAVFMRQMPRALLEAARGASLLIMDAQYTDDEYQQQRGSGHASCISTTDFALQTGAQQLALFHHAPSASDLDLEERARSCAERAAKFGAPLTVFPAREGMALQV